MKFLNDLYTIVSSRMEEGVQLYNIQLNPEHVIYRAHFPGEPITPGVCILQIGLELLSLSIGAELELIATKNVKFLNILIPDGQQVTVRIRSEQHENDSVRAQVEISTGETTIAKLSLICQIAKTD